MTQWVLIAVVYVSAIVPDVVATLKLAPPKKEVVAFFRRVVWQLQGIGGPSAIFDAAAAGLSPAPGASPFSLPSISR